MSPALLRSRCVGWSGLDWGDGETLYSREASDPKTALLNIWHECVVSLTTSFEFMTETTTLNPFSIVVVFKPQYLQRSSPHFICCKLKYDSLPTFRTTKGPTSTLLPLNKLFGSIVTIQRRSRKSSHKQPCFLSVKVPLYLWGLDRTLIVQVLWLSQPQGCSSLQGAEWRR